jgi:hypothetical protein
MCVDQEPPADANRIEGWPGNQPDPTVQRRGKRSKPSPSGPSAQPELPL